MFKLYWKDENKEKEAGNDIYFWKNEAISPNFISYLPFELITAFPDMFTKVIAIYRIKTVDFSG